MKSLKSHGRDNMGLGLLDNIDERINEFKTKINGIETHLDSIESKLNIIIKLLEKK